MTKQQQGGAMSESEPSQFRPAGKPAVVYNFDWSGGQSNSLIVAFNRTELRYIFTLYGQMVAAGEWRDYAIDMLRDKAVFSIFRRSCECPLYRIEKNPRLARKQGAYSVIAPAGLILKRGHELHRVLAVLDHRLRLAGA
jgi:hypothetical protein